MKKYLALVLLPLLIFFMAGTASAETTADRIDGQDRFQVAVNVSKKGWSGGADTVVLTYYNAYADALSASPLAYQKNAPILLTQSNKLTYATKQEIDRLNPNQVIVVGGSASVSEAVLNELRGMGISSVKRIGGKDRFEVAYMIAKEMPSSSKAVIAYGLNFPDALAIAPYAARNGYPILLANTSVLPSKTKQALSERGTSSTIVVGGEGSIGSSVYSQLPNPKRIGGKDRFEVAANIINTLNLPANKAYLSTGLTFADALTGSVLAAKQNAPILLTMPDRVPAATMNVINDRDIQYFTVLGGTASVSSSVVEKVAGPLAVKTIVVDPGHGGTDPGASGNGLVEKELALDISKRLQTKLLSAGSEVLMTRTTNKYYPTLSERVKLANDSQADAFISIHMNAYTPSAEGTETYWNSSYSSAESEALASSIQKEMLQELGTRDRGVKQANFQVIKYTKIPSVLVEVAFVTNSGDAELLADSTFREKAATAIYQGTLNYFKTYN